MSDVFVSYARSTEPQAKEIAQALRSEGFSVWRDDEIPAHKPYAEVIEDRLRSSKAVLVIWSADAVKSQWVRAEADAARELGTLIQATVDGTLPPLPFNQIQCAGIDCSNDGVAGRGWEKLKASVGALVRGERIAVPEAVARLEPGKNAICVLPFVNMSGDAEQEYFSDGISEDITTDLSKISALSVTARNTAFTFKGQAADVCAIARKLRVSHVLEGSVRKAGGRVRISAQLIDGRTGDHVWADRYDRELTDIFAIQDEISHAIVDALKVKLLPDEKRAIEQRGTSSVDAYGLYLLARKYFSLTYFGGGQQEQKIIRICKRAVELDPSYAEAWGLLAWVQSTLFTYSEGSEDGTAAARRALALDPTIAAAHCVIARRLLEEGRERETEESIAEALRLEPEAWEVNREAGRTYYNQNRYSEAVPYLEEALSMVEIDYSAWQMLASAYRTLGDEAGLARAAERMVSHSRRILGEDPGNTEALATNACGIAIQGDVRQFKERIELALLLDPDNMLSRYNFACMAAAFLGDVDMAVDLLGPVFEVGTSSSFVRFAMADPDLAEARKNRQIRKMLAGATKRLLAVPEASPAASAARPRS